MQEPAPSAPQEPAPSAAVPPALKYLAVAVTFLIVGVVIGLAASGAFISRADVEQAVRSALETTRVGIDDTALQDVISQIAAAAPAGAGGASLDADALSAVVLQALDQQRRDEALRERIRMVDDDPALGSPDAPIAIVEFSAYACPFCARHFIETLQPLLDHYGQYIHYVYRDFPVINQDVSFPTAMAAECAHEQGKFWEFHDLMFRNHSQLGRELFLRAAEELALDVAAFTTCIDENHFENEVLDDYHAAAALGITGTPTFYINGQIVSGALPFERFERIILAQLAEQGITPEGVAAPEDAAGS